MDQFWPCQLVVQICYLHHCLTRTAAAVQYNIYNGSTKGQDLIGNKKRLLSIHRTYSYVGLKGGKKPLLVELCPQNKNFCSTYSTNLKNEH